MPVPKNIYGVTKTAAEDLCQLFHRNEGLAAIVLRTSRFFPEEDDDPAARKAYPDDNAKANEYLFRRVAIEDVVDAHLLAIERAPAIGFGKYIISATTPFLPGDCARLRVDAAAVVSLRAPGWEDEYGRRGWRMFPSIDRVYDNALARQDLGWRPSWDFAAIVERLRETGDIRGPLAKQIGVKGYHAERFEGAPYPVTGARGSANSPHGDGSTDPAATPRCCGLATAAGCLKERLHSTTRAARRRSPTRWRSTLAGRPSVD